MVSILVGVRASVFPTGSLRLSVERLIFHARVGSPRVLYPVRTWNRPLARLGRHGNMDHRRRCVARIIPAFHGDTIDAGSSRTWALRAQLHGQILRDLPLASGVDRAISRD